MDQATLSQLIEFARAARLAQPKHPEGYRPLVPTPDGPTITPEKRRLLGFLQDLPVETQREVMALCWFGRGDFDDYEEAQEHAKGMGRDSIAGYLTGKAPLDQYLLKGSNRRLGIPEQTGGSVTGMGIEEDAPDGGARE